jgi:glycosyltransferase domain-containing protein
MDISIIIPTKNRSKYLFKLLNYYEAVNFMGQLIIIDSSDKNIFINNKNFIDSKKNLDIQHQFKDINELNARKYALKFINKNYIAQSGDDDYYEPIGVQKIINFLNINLDYSCASGYTYATSYNLDKNLIKGSTKYYLQSSEKNTSLERLKDLKLENTPVIDFSIYRRKIFEKIMYHTLDDERANLFFKRIFNEYTFRIYSFLFGKCISLNIFYLVRLRVKENNQIASQNMKQIYINDKKSFFLSYYLLIRKIINLFKQLNLLNSEEFYLCKKKLKKTVMIRIKPTFLMMLEKKSISIYEITRSLIYRFYNKLNFKKSKNFNEEFNKIIEFIKIN